MGTLRKLRRLHCWNNTSGSVTLEAAVVFPWIIMITLALLLFSLFIGQRSLLYYSSSITVERSAFNWSNSAKDARTGAYPPNEHDGLYWRLLSDALVDGLFGLAAETGGVQVAIPAGTNETGGSGVTGKLMSSASLMPDSITGSIAYRNIGVKRQINLQAASGWVPGPLIWLRGDDAAASNVSALIVEPAEFLRSFDLVRYYAMKMQKAPEGEAAFRRQAASVLNNRRNP